tara:strand:+ start:595 stop:1209 length:615 start_codon:yes stop_codon:yes gene_type:complete
MNVTSHRDPTPHIRIKDIFSDDILYSIWNEIDELHDHLLPPKNTGSAHRNNQLLKQNSGLYLYSHYKDSVESSKIINAIHNVVFHPQIMDAWCYDHLSKMIKITNWETVLLSYYNEGDLYRPHHDVAMFTTLIWLWREPKAFTGGDLKLNQYDHMIKAENNSGIIFLSPEIHSVSSVIKTNHWLNKMDNYGRYCISHFCGIKNV